MSQTHSTDILCLKIIQDGLNSARIYKNHLQTICEQGKIIQAHGVSAAPVPSVRKVGRPHSGG